MIQAADKATILTSRDGKRLTKIFKADENGIIQKTDYQNAFLFIGSKISMNNIDDFYELQKSLINEPYKMLIRGELIGKAASFSFNSLIRPTPF